MIFRFVLIFLFISFNAYSTDCEKPKMPTDDEWNNWLSNIKKEALDKQIDEEIKKTEQEIETLKKNAPEKINKIAIETSSEILKNLIGAEVNNSSISAIVEDLSKRNGDKYHGN